VIEEVNMAIFLKKILWATDFSDEALEALLYAHAFAKVFKAKIIALHVIPGLPPSILESSYAFREELFKSVRNSMNEAKRKLEKMRKAKAIPFKVIVKDGSASKTIIETAEKEKVDLIAIGKRGMSAIEKLFIGSVANQVLRNSPVPVLITKKRAGKPSFKKILVPTDFSAQEEVERDYAWKLAKGFRSDITLFHVLELYGHEFSEQVVEELLKSLQKRLRQRKKREKANIRVREEISRAVNASSGIVDYAETHNYDLIVISTCVQKGLERFFLGSTTEKVISYTHIPVFAIPPAKCAK
jgi:nucleotide-binding universal stress UspA family protein